MTMPAKEAAKVLREHNAWRRGEVTNPMPYSPRMLGEAIDAAVAALEAVPNVPLSALVCVGRARFPRTGGNAGIAWHVEDALSDTGGFRSGSPCNGELLFVLPTTAKRAMLAASKAGEGK